MILESNMNNLNLNKWTSRFLLGLGLVTVSITATAAVIESEPNNSFDFADFGAPGLNTGVIGDLSAASNDVDIWKFDLTAGAFFSANISNGLGADFNLFNPLMTLYMKNGGNYYAVSGAINNPGSSSNFGFTAWESGTYFLTVSAFANSPEDAFGNNGYDSSFWSQNGSLGTAFSQFEGGSFSSFDYNLSLNGTIATSPVPVPAAAWLFASGLFGLVGLSRRKQIKA